MCLLGKLASATLCILSRLHHAPMRPTTSSALRGTRACTALPAPSRQFTPFACVGAGVATTSGFFAANADGVEGITDRKSSGMCEAPASAVSDTTVASGPSEARVSSAARSGEDCGGLKTGVRRRGVADAGRGTLGFAWAGAAGAIETF